MTGGSIIKVCCVKTGRRYGNEYVHRLYNAIRTNLSYPFEWVCISDDDEVGTHHTDLPGWWAKLMVFFIQGRRLYFDLDTIITGNIDGFAEYDGDFCCIKPFYRNGGIASGVMNIGPGIGYDLWQRFRRDPSYYMRLCREQADPPWNHGDQRLLELEGFEPDYWQDLLPGQLVSYKVHCADGLPEGARVVCFHGLPDPHQVQDDWVRSRCGGMAGA